MIMWRHARAKSCFAGHRDARRRYVVWKTSDALGRNCEFSSSGDETPVLFLYGCSDFGLRIPGISPPSDVLYRAT